MKGVVMVEMVNLELVHRLDRPVTEIRQGDGMDGLRTLLGIGESLARSIHALATTSRLSMLERLWGESDPVALLTSGPGIGKALATRLHEDLGIDTFEELEAAMYKGSLSQVTGFAKKSRRGLESDWPLSLGGFEGRSSEQPPTNPP
jgi:DNA polymerase/3'-5' exonuclease PolX